MRTLMAAGGTGGHIFPALAVAEELRRRSGLQSRNIQRDNHAVPLERRSTLQDDCVIEFLGTGRGLEARLIPASGFPLHIVPAAGLKGMPGRKLARGLLVLPRTFLETSRVLHQVQPDVVLGMGGYLAGPVMLQAALQDIPTLLVEPNALPGFTNRLLAPVVRVAAVGFEQAAEFYGTKARVTGHAVRQAFFGIPPKLHEPPFTLLIVGGSQGSAAINRMPLRTFLITDMAIAKTKPPCSAPCCTKWRSSPTWFWRRRIEAWWRRNSRPREALTT